MKPYGNQLNLEKKVPYEGKKDSEKISIINIKLVHQIFDTINISLLVLICTLFFLSFDSQKKWSNSYKLLLKIKENNSNLIDYISKTEGLYISRLESLNSLKKTTPGDLIYIDRISEKQENFFNNILKNTIKGIGDSEFQRGY